MLQIKPEAGQIWKDKSNNDPCFIMLITEIGLEWIYSINKRGAYACFSKDFICCNEYVGESKVKLEDLFKVKKRMHPISVAAQKFNKEKKRLKKLGG